MCHFLNHLQRWPHSTSQGDSGVGRREMTEITELNSHFLFGGWHECTCVSSFCIYTTSQKFYNIPFSCFYRKSSPVNDINEWPLYCFFDTTIFLQGYEGLSQSQLTESEGGYTALWEEPENSHRQSDNMQTPHRKAPGLFSVRQQTTFPPCQPPLIFSEHVKYLEAALYTATTCALLTSTDVVTVCHCYFRVASHSVELNP